PPPLQRLYRERAHASCGQRRDRARDDVGGTAPVLRPARRAAEPLLPRFPRLPGAHAREQPGAPRRVPEPPVRVDAHALTYPGPAQCSLTARGERVEAARCASW